MNDNDNESKAHNNKAVLESEFLERKRIKIIEDSIVGKLNKKKNEYLDELNRSYEERIDKINSHDDLLSAAIKTGNADELKKVFQIILDDRKKK